MTGSPSAGRLAGRVALITGGAQGIGAATARRFAAEGAAVAVLDLRGDEGERTAAGIRDAGGEAVFYEADVTQEEACRRAIDAAAQRFGRLDAVVTCAGILQGAHATLEELERDVFERVQSVNVRGTFLTAKHTVRHLTATGGGVLLLISSGAGVRSPSSSIAYGTSKAAVHGLYVTLEPRLARHAIRVLAVCPGSIDTPLKRQNVADGARAAGRDPQRAVAEAHLGDPDGVARVLAFLASDDGAYVRGTVFTR